MTEALPMISFASIGEIEYRDGKPTVAVCEVEKIDIKESKPEERYKERFKAHISMQEINDNVGEVVEGDILVVSHENDVVITVIRKDDAEKERRIAILKQLEAAIFNKQ